MENLMETLPRNVILDLLPAYIAGEASEESRTLVEAFAKKDPEIDRVVRTGKLDPGTFSQAMTAPDDLEMKTVKRLRRTILRRLWTVALVTAAILMVPLVAMMFTGEVHWKPGDFIIGGLLLFGAGSTYVLISRVSDRIAYRAAAGIGVAAGLLLVWVNLAVGIIGSEDNPANLLYAGVLAILVTGAAIARLKSQGMASTMFAAAIAQLLVPVLAMVIWRSSLNNSPAMTGVFVFNAFFAAMFAVSALLFRRAMRKQLAD